MIIFNQRVKHERMEFFPGVSLAMPAQAERYFVACGWADTTNEPAVVTYDDISVDPEAVIAETGKLVLGSE